MPPGFDGGAVSSTSSSGTVSTGSVTLEWDAPITNDDSPANSELVDLAGYNIYYYPKGLQSSAQTVQIENNFTSATVSGLTPGTWCFITTAYDYTGNESSDSNEICSEITTISNSTIPLYLISFLLPNSEQQVLNQVKTGRFIKTPSFTNLTLRLRSYFIYYCNETNFGIV